MTSLGGSHSSKEVPKAIFNCSGKAGGIISAKGDFPSEILPEAQIPFPRIR